MGKRSNELRFAIWHDFYSYFCSNLSAMKRQGGDEPTTESKRFNNGDQINQTLLSVKISIPLRHEAISNTDLEQLFLKFLDNRGQGLSESELLKLDRLLVFDSSDSVFSNLGTKLTNFLPDQRKTFVKLAESALKNQEAGSWIIRPSRIKDNEKSGIFARTISCIDINRKVTHGRLLHIVGNGFCLQHNATEDLDLDTFKIEDHRLDCFPSLIRLIEFCSKEMVFNLAKYYRVPKSAYIEKIAREG